MRNTYHGQREESIDPASGEETTKAMNGMGGSQQQRMKGYVFTASRCQNSFQTLEQMSDMEVTVCATLPPTGHLKHH
ncbi:hypothetical protein XELAEV_18021496mg [Xenopus laevis]|uniref:Uncharacterized protein n=1 Tax=Xenopus laevis TaxID=8355 RepID=A0A974HRE4_XENLA|nr:hypothetical protein XELAEV_18021496mg [Xenopus laevis]